jgi:transcriptional regulator with XRE-family HTH domain
MNSISFGERLAAIRNAVGYAKNQLGFAKLYKVSKTTWSGYETNKTSPDASLLIKLCMDWKVNPRWLIKGSGEMFDNEEPMGNISETIEDLPVSEILEIQRQINSLLSARLQDRQ